MLRVLLALPALALVSGVLVGGHLYLARRFASDLGLPAGLESVGHAVVWVGAVSLLLQPVSERLVGRPWSLLVAWPASLWMGFAFLAIVGVGAADLAKLALEALGVPAWNDTSASRVLLPAVLVVGVVALRAGLRGPSLVRVEIAPEGWPPARDGYRIVQISDIHIGPLLDRRFAASLVERVNALEPDLIAVTGDLVDGSVALLRDDVAPFAELSARDGVYFVTGNHDHYSGASAWAAHAAKLGMRVLRNERVTVEGREPGAAFELAGVDDHRGGFNPAEGSEDLDAALASLPTDRPTLLLAHDPSTFKRAQHMGIALQLSGHTHGGQIWPFRYGVRLMTPYVAGLYRRGRAWIYVSRGTGFWGPPMRLLAPAEITEIRLRAGGAGAGARRAS